MTLNMYFTQNDNENGTVHSRSNDSGEFSAFPILLRCDDIDAKNNNRLNYLLLSFK